MIGDGTEEQNLNQPGTPGARSEKDELTAAFEKKVPQNLDVASRGFAEKSIDDMN